MEGREKSRNLGLDVLRLFCAFLIVWRHSEQHGVVILEPYTRAAVPVFFMITGYFYTGSVQTGRCVKQIRKLISLFLWTFLVYALWDFVMIALPVIHMEGNLLSCFFSWLNYFLFHQRERWLELLVFNSPFVGEHLWYLLALLYVLIFVAVFEHFADRRKLYFLIPVLLMANLILGSYAVFLFGKQFPAMYIRNCVLTGLPFFLLGDWLNAYEQRLCIKTRQLWLILFVSLLTTAAEEAYLSANHWKGYLDLYFSTPFTASALFLLANGRTTGEGTLWEKLAEKGRAWSLWIYLFHPLVIALLNLLIRPRLEEDGLAYKLFYMGFPVIVLAGSIAVAVGLQTVKCRRKRR